MLTQSFCLAGAITSVRRAGRVHCPHLAPFLTPHLGTTGGPIQDRDAAGQDPDPGLSLGPHPDPDHHRHRFAIGSGEMLTGQLILQFFCVDVQ